MSYTAIYEGGPFDGKMLEINNDEAYETLTYPTFDADGKRLPDIVYERSRRKNATTWRYRYVVPREELREAIMTLLRRGMTPADAKDYIRARLRNGRTLEDIYATTRAHYEKEMQVG